MKNLKQAVFTLLAMALFLIPWNLEAKKPDGRQGGGHRQECSACYHRAAHFRHRSLRSCHPRPRVFFHHPRRHHRFYR